MPYKIDFLGEGVVEWSLTEDGAAAERVPDYTPTFYVGAREADSASLADVRDRLAQFPAVARTAFEEWRPGFRHGPERTVWVDVPDVEAVTRLARWVRERGPPGAYRCFNVDFSREFRYCLERDRSPTPARALSTLTIEGEAHAFDDVEVPPLTIAADPADADPDPIESESVGGTPDAALPRIEALVERADPDVLVVDSARLLAELHALADRVGYDLQFGRRPGFQRLAGASTYTSYGRVGHSPARYNVPGRVVVDRSNTFFYSETNVEGCLDLVARSRKPLQELAWASIGTVLTAIQVREALARDVLVPWQAWRPERFKTMEQLRDADRGGFTFAPDVGVYEDVHELDFSSLYPNIICTRNVSPETVRCDCHADREDVPGLRYSVCDERGYLPDVLEPLVEDRDEIEAALRATDDPERAAALEGRSDAIKWILVSCFGYQGFSNAKFGRIECHEAINAFAREILLDAKETLEAGGWRVVHGIVDSIWVTPRDGDDQRPLGELAAEITDDVGIRLEYETAYEWVAFVPRRDSDAGALTKYFGARAGGDGEYKYRGIECRQRSTSEFVADVQRDLIAAFDARRSPEAVCDRLARALDRLRAGAVDPSALAIATSTAKRIDEYRRSTRTVAAVARAADRGREPSPGQSVEYVVVDDDKRSRDRVALVEAADDYDATFYADRLLRAAESVLAPVGWRTAEIREYLADRTDASLRSYGG
ncbi:DNA polymerase I [Halobacteriales archaeon QS_1_67_19]|nr:MAG: DNA polymerase I [Halobacteriales archaeon QS_1_67_19]